MPATMPAFVPPELCRVTAVPPVGPNWIHEIKFDGYRSEIRVLSHTARLFTRTGLDWTHRFPEIVKESKQLPDCILDGEIVALDAKRRSDFSRLQNALSTGRTGALILYVFDLLYLGRRDLRHEPLAMRKSLLEKILGSHAANEIRYVGHTTTGGTALLDAACRLGLEGVISKRVDSPYRSGRGNDWCKSKCRGGQEVVIGGWSAEGSRLKSLLVGMYDGRHLIYAGRVGTGFNARSSGGLVEKLRALERPSPPFTSRPPLPRTRELHWVDPKLVAEIEFGTMTRDGLLRHASFKGLRQDKEAGNVVREPQPVAEMKVSKNVPHRETRAGMSNNPAVAGISISHPGKILWPAHASQPAITKLDLAQYYEALAERILPHVARRPLSIVRAPDGIGGQRFFQRHILEGVPHLIAIRVRGESRPSLAIDSAAGLVALAQAAVLEFHPWGCRKDEPESPERIIFDIDPAEGLAFGHVVAAARDLRDRLTLCGMEPFVKTTGGKGLHVVVAIKPARDRVPAWSDAKAFAHALSLRMERDCPDRYVTNMSKRLRQGKIFLDYLRNDKSATGVGPYSPRARPGAPVAMPISWREVSENLDPARFTLASWHRDIRRKEWWKDLAKSAVPLEAAKRRLSTAG